MTSMRHISRVGELESFRGPIHLYALRLPYGGDRDVARGWLRMAETAPHLSRCDRGALSAADLLLRRRRTVAAPRLLRGYLGWWACGALSLGVPRVWRNHGADPAAGLRAQSRRVPAARVNVDRDWVQRCEL